MKTAPSPIPLLLCAMALSGCADRNAPPEAAPGDASQTGLSTATTPDEAGLVDIASLVPDIALDIRYAGEDNFVGAPVDGYAASRCYLQAPAAEALQRVENSLREEGFRLLIFDCYRPARAVAHFMRWVDDAGDQRTRARHYPNLDKQDLPGEYIAPVSGHSRGATVDLTLLDCRTGDCAPLDMGTDFDFFDPIAHTDSPDADDDQRRNRARLVSAMAREGLENYPQEWWHYTLGSWTSSTRYDVPIE